MARLSPRSLIVLGAVSLVTCNSDVETKNDSYSCCDGVIPFDPNCEAQWSFNNSPFAVSSPRSNMCTSPCQKIADGQMVMEKCLNVNASYTYTDEHNMLTEEMVQYQCQPCPRSGGTPGHRGSLGLLLAAFVLLQLMFW
ncbi:uncharacterized protein V6R79_022806 [Siganus canaliculatus]